MHVMDIDNTTVRRVGDHWHYSDGTVLPVVSGGDESAFVEGVVESHNTAIEDGFVNVPGGVLLGVEPPTPPSPSAQVQPGQPAPPAVVPTTQQVDPNTGRTFTAVEVEAIRKQERDKLYADLEKEKSRRKELEKADRERQDAETARAEELESEARRAAEAEMDARQLVEARTAQFEQQLAVERQQREALEATLDQERRYVQLDHYRAGRVTAVQDEILPELIDLISGNSEEEIEQSIESLRARTASILGNVQQTVAATRQGMQGASVTAPPVGPMDTQQSYQQISPQEIAAMTPQEYAQHRDRLLGAVRQRVNQQGIYGP